MKTDVILGMFVCVLLVGCKVTEKKAKKWAYDNKGVLATWCVDCFGDRQEPIYIQGKTITKIDTVRDSIPTPVYVYCPDGSKVKADCPPSERIIIDNSRVDTSYQDRPATLAKLKVLEDKVKSLETDLLFSQNDLSEMTKRRNDYRKWFFMALGIVALYSIGRIVLAKLF